MQESIVSFVGLRDQCAGIRAACWLACCAWSDFQGTEVGCDHPDEGVLFSFLFYMMRN